MFLRFQAGKVHARDSNPIPLGSSSKSLSISHRCFYREPGAPESPQHLKPGLKSGSFPHSSKSQSRGPGGRPLHLAGWLLSGRAAGSGEWEAPLKSPHAELQKARLVLCREQLRISKGRQDVKF